ncbi:MAG TPA: hypothetical protein VFI25_10165 [Planctomycetota bacterium]|jgi:hypothetical protein|nr:hypothetical protein [Planctomycetota bacterium]
MALPAMLACLLLQTTWVVDDNGGPGVNFIDLPPAVAAAADGDILLVQPGTYSHFTLTGKGLRIFGSGVSVTIVANPNPSSSYSQTTLAAIPPSSIAHIEGMLFRYPFGPTTFSPARVVVSGPTTRATFADVEIAGPLGLGAPSPGFPALRVDAAEAKVVRCTVQGGAGVSYFTPALGSAGNRGLEAMNGARVHVASSVITGGEGSGGCLLMSSGIGGLGGQAVSALSSSEVWIADSTVIGGNSGCCGFSTSQCNAGGAGISANGAFVRVSGDATSLVRGGDAGNACLFFPNPPGPGIEAVGSLVEVHSVPVIGGCLCGTSCTPGPAVVGTGVTLNAPALPVLEVSGTLTTTGTATITLSNGLPNAAFVIAFAATPGHIPGGSFFLGEILLDSVNWYLLAIGSLSPGGDVTLTLPLTGIPPGFVYLPVYLQGLVFDPQGLWRMSDATVAAIRP